LAFDRLSSFAKIYHMQEEANRAEASQDHRDKCQVKLNRAKSKENLKLLMIYMQKMEFMKVYKQMKMYKDI
jgi:hypothetical protein